MKLFNIIFDCWYSSLKDIIHNVNLDLAIEVMQQLIEAYLNSIIIAVIIDKLYKRE
jgi:hypothetical protein